MNNQILVQGRRELIVASSAVIVGALCIRALTAVPFTGLAYQFPSTPANADAATAGTLPAGMQLEYVDEVTLTSGTVEVIYQF